MRGRIEKTSHGGTRSTKKRLQYKEKSLNQWSNFKTDQSEKQLFVKYEELQPN